MKEKSNIGEIEMKIKKILALLTATVTCVTASPIMAQTVDLVVDGHKILTSKDVEEDKWPDIEVPAQVINNVTLVPLRFISQCMCADVDYKEGIITIINNKDVLKLEVGKKSVTKNGQILSDLEVAPVVKEGITLVPLRFIAETFEADVNYKDGRVTIDTPVAVYQGVKIKTLHWYIDMTMGGTIDEAVSNKTIEKTLLELNIIPANEVAKPQKFTDDMGKAMEEMCCYFTSSKWIALDENNNEVFRYELYQLLNNYEGVDLPDWLIHDVKNDKWYKYEYKDEEVGIWQLLHNDVA